MNQKELQLVEQHDGKITTTSMTVAAKFEKRHDDVLKAIRNLLKDETVSSRGNFAECLKINELANGKKEPFFEMDRDGFVLLTMGFTGKKALQFKMSYIDAFNAAEKALIQIPSVVHDPQTRALIQLLTETDAIKRECQTLGNQQQVLAVGVSEVRKDVADLKANMKLENWQQANMLKAVNHKVEVWKEMYPCLNIRKAYPAIYRHLKDKFSVPRYDEIPAVEYDRAISLVRNLNLNQLAGL